MVHLAHLPGILALLAAAPAWRFFAEDVRLEVKAETLRVRGEYHFARGEASPATLPIFYPFPDDDTLGEARIESLLISRGDRWAPLDHETRLPAGVLFALSGERRDTVVVRVVYTQPLLAPSARYIVKSALAWKEPLDLAKFTVCLPEGIQAAEFTLPLRAAPGLGPSCYAATFERFVPEEDLIVRWHPP